MPLFPSVEWFDAIRNIINNDPNFRKNGTCDATVGIKVADDIFVLTFEAFECTEARAGTEEDLVFCDFYLELEYGDWKEMILNIKEHGKADFEHTLNSIDLNILEGFELDKSGGFARSKTNDQYRRDLFFRYNQSFQDFFDASSKIETTFRE